MSEYSGTLVTLDTADSEALRAENAALKARVERIEAAARDAALGRAVAEAAARFKDADDIALTEDVSIWEDDCHGGDSRTLLVIDDDQHALLADISEAIATHRAALEEP